MFKNHSMKIYHIPNPPYYCIVGTDPLSIQDWIDDLDFVKTTYPYCNGCEVHEGFYNAFLSVRDQVVSSVKGFKSTYSSATVTVTGHSLGAAMAAHCAAELVHTGYNITTVYSYGMPRVGNQAFEQWYVTVVPGTFRNVHKKDPVPHLPPNNWGFHHMPYEVSILQISAQILLLVVV
ncbi:lipase family protein [archaeon]|nr:MAG: lipase family protein [archaeon]